MKASFLTWPAIILLSLAAAGASAGNPGGISEALVAKLTAGGLAPDKTTADIVAGVNLPDIALNRERLLAHNAYVNFKIKTGDITNQKGSGRCWMFAGENVLRPRVIEKYKLKKFEFSENYLMFWDKLEKVNLFLQGMIDMAARPLDDRELEVLLHDPIGDGGWWSYFTDLIRKYGLVPKEIMPETYNSSATGTMNTLLLCKVKEMGLTLRGIVRSGATAEAVENSKAEMLTDVYRILVLNLGQPPREFTWRYEADDSTGIVTHPKTFTPLTFFKEVIGDDLSDYVALFNYPGKEYLKNYSLRLSRNMYDRPNLTVLNLPIDSLRAYALKSILDSTPVWFACDVGQENYGKAGLMALGIYNYESIYGTQFDLPKADLIQTQLITPNHAMAFIGVDTVGGAVQKWLVENSWGEDAGDKGKWYMYNDWFDRYLFGVIIHKKYLTDQLIKLSAQPPIELPPWDPMWVLNRLE